jgi:hypothetical protein
MWEPQYYDETIDFNSAKPMAFRDMRLDRLTKSAMHLLATGDQLNEDKHARFGEILERPHAELSMAPILVLDF